jgi:hypothetical protein
MIGLEKQRSSYFAYNLTTQLHLGVEMLERIKQSEVV